MDDRFPDPRACGWIRMAPWLVILASCSGGSTHAPTVDVGIEMLDARGPDPGSLPDAPTDGVPGDALVPDQVARDLGGESVWPDALPPVDAGPDARPDVLLFPCQPNPSCDDSNPCTEDLCDKELGCLHHKAIHVCDDGNPCTVKDKCVEGKCQGSLVTCDDGDPCSDDGCDPIAGVCLHVPNSANCSDGSLCTVGDQCEGGTCLGTDIGCSCQESAECAKFEDGDLCNGTLFCDDSLAQPKCKVDPKTVKHCTLDPAYSPLCTKVICDSKSGECKTYLGEDGKTCDDDNFCTEDDTCLSGMCVGSGETVCDDGNPCTKDTCKPLVGCVHDNQAVECEPARCDGKTFLLPATCAFGLCPLQHEVPCDDDLECTGDTCSVPEGCVHPLQSGWCLIDGSCYTASATNGGCKGCQPDVAASIWTDLCKDGQRCVDGTCCTPGCTGKACGTDGCGGSCGDCTCGQTCDAGACVFHGCDGRACGSDGCGGSCGSCDVVPPNACLDGETLREYAGTGACQEVSGKCDYGYADISCASGCFNAKCVNCTPKCAGKWCGPDTCGGKCGTCPEGKTCSPGGFCSDSCGNGTCEPGEDCDACPADCGCPGGTICYAGGCCVPRTCTQLGKLCGSWDDGCGGVAGCGNCGPGATCHDGFCEPFCMNGVCDADKGENCATCPADCKCAGGSKCVLGACCKPQDCLALQKQCGSWDDGCGGTADCGSCLSGFACVHGYCIAGCGNGSCDAGVGEGCTTCPSDCGCTPGTVCFQNACCVPKSCTALGNKKCGTWDDGCGGNTTCGTCDSPPPAECVGSDARQYSLPGTCDSFGDCKYKLTVTSCPNGCSGGACTGCTPKCDGKCSGGNGCGGQCPDTCAATGQVCNPQTQACCTRKCQGKTCGPDSCGGTCGTCPNGFECLADGTCNCTDSCFGKECGTDLCGNPCGTCLPGNDCSAGKCVCHPSCGIKVCGDDGCGGSCGECTNPPAAVCQGSSFRRYSLPATCNVSNLCQYTEDVTSCPNGCDANGCKGCTPNCTGKECGDDGCGHPCSPGCSPATDFDCVSGDCVPICGKGGCQKAYGENCDTCSADCKCDLGYACESGVCKPPCLPSCSGKECGPDGCGGTCGTCQVDKECVDGKCVCVPDCGISNQCGPDGCGEVCGECNDPPAAYCVDTGTVRQFVSSGLCLGTVCSYSSTDTKCANGCETGKCKACTPACSGKCLVPDGCGGTCPDCASPQVCNPDTDACCTRQCTGKQCGSDGCGGTCGECNTPPSSQCMNGTLFVQYSSSGTCNGSSKCEYAVTSQISCPYGCDASGCKNCVPACDGKTCGSDGCGHECSPGCPADFECVSGACLPVCGQGGCQSKYGENCENCHADCKCDVGWACIAGVCEPPCPAKSCTALGKTCGWWDNGCGMQIDCGTCPDHHDCTDGTCVCIPQCTGKKCGSDGCYGNCGNCPDGYECDSGTWTCKLRCGNGICQMFDYGENCSSCPADCGCAADEECVSFLGAMVCKDKCGNGKCDTGENCLKCAVDCPCGVGTTCMLGACLTYCGNGTCDPDENCFSCGSDCPCGAGKTCVLGACLTYCGNGTCDPGENCENCKADCGCQFGYTCQGGVCKPPCPVKTCEQLGKTCDSWSDGCGGSVFCGICPTGNTCNNGTCQPVCGDGLCVTGETTSTCCTDCGCGSATKCCVNNVCNTRQICNPLKCGTMSDGCGGTMDCSCISPSKCVGGTCCAPQCSGKNCGDDGCGGSCGACIWPGTCISGQCCTPNCSGKNCGSNGCGGSCGTCGLGKPDCVNGICTCLPKCSGKECGSDMCGGSCGTCTAPESCVSYQCVCTPNCTNKECGSDGCGGSCGTCTLPKKCCSGLTGTYCDKMCM